MAMYLISQVDVEIEYYYLLHQVIIALPRKKQYSMIDFMFSRLPV